MVFPDLTGFVDLHPVLVTFPGAGIACGCNKSGSWCWLCWLIMVPLSLMLLWLSVFLSLILFFLPAPFLPPSFTYSSSLVQCVRVLQPCPWAQGELHWFTSIYVYVGMAHVRMKGRKRVIVLKSLLHDRNKKGPLKCVCGLLVTYKAIFKPASDVGGLALVRRKKGENLEHIAVTGLGCEEEDWLAHKWRCNVMPWWWPRMIHSDDESILLLFKAFDLLSENKNNLSHMCCSKLLLSSYKVGQK